MFSGRKTANRIIKILHNNESIRIPSSAYITSCSDDVALGYRLYLRSATRWLADSDVIHRAARTCSMSTCKILQSAVSCDSLCCSTSYNYRALFDDRCMSLGQDIVSRVLPACRPNFCM